MDKFLTLIAMTHLAISIYKHSNGDLKKPVIQVSVGKGRDIPHNYR